MCGLLLAGLGGLAGGAGLIASGWLRFRLALILGVPLLFAGAVLLVLGIAMVAYWRLGKRRMREKILNMLSWTGIERVLDVGTGAGLLLIGAAKRLTSGSAVGIDIWRRSDLSGNCREAACGNAIIEGVADRVEVLTGDASALAFPDATFDRVISLLCLHNIEPASGQRIACHEIARVLKPDGVALIADYVPTTGYARAFAEAGLKVRGSRMCFGTALSLMWLVVAEKT